MKLIEFFTRIDMNRVDELFIRYKPETKKDSYELISSRENIWIYSSEDEDNERLIADIQQRTGLQGDDVRDLAQRGADRGDIITGLYNPSEHSLWYYGDPGRLTHNPAVSLQFKKLVDYMGIYFVNGSRLSGNDDVEVETHSSEMKGEHPDEAWHGTNTGAINSILTVGLVPGAGETNWEDIGQFGDVVFLSEDFYNAKFHAERQSNNKGNVEPVILKFKIPDKNLIVPDYDMEISMGNNPEVADELGYSASPGYYDDYQMKNREEATKYNPGTDLTKVSGIFGYKGRIPANHITEIVANLSGELAGGSDDGGADYYEFNSVEEFRDALNIYHDHGYWYEGIEDELADMEQEDDE